MKMSCQANRKLFLSVVVFFSLLVPPSQGLATPMREFVMSCTYGVLAGTLVGAAMLAFEDQPGDNLNKVARGASIGLYAGIALGLYVVYVVPGQADELDGLPPPEGAYGVHWRQPKLPDLQVFPLLSVQDQRIDGWAANYNLMSF